MSNTNFQKQIQSEVLRSELSRIKLFVATLTVGLLSMSFLFYLLSDVTDFFDYSITPKIVVLWIFLFLMYELGMLMVIRTIIKRQEPQSTKLKIFNIFIEAIFPGILLFLLCLIEETPKFLDSPLFLFYFIIIVLSALSLDIKLALLTCFLSALSYLGVTIWAINTFDPNFETMNLHPFLYEIRSAFILMGGLCAVFVTSEIKKRSERVNQLWKEKIEIEGLFGQQVSPQVAKALVKDQSHTLKTEVSVLFLDIRNFSSFVELKDPQEVNDFQNSLFCPLIEIINKHKGVVNQILGDGFMATFGVPVEDQNHISQSVSAGLEMLEKLESLISQKIIPPTKVGIGVHTGKVVTGNIGNEIRKQYSVSGTTVVIAARLEQLNKQLNTRFLISQNVYNVVKDEVCNFSIFKGIQLKGFEKTICVYGVSNN